MELRSVKFFYTKLGKTFLGFVQGGIVTPEQERAFPKLYAVANRVH